MVQTLEEKAAARAAKAAKEVEALTDGLKAAGVKLTGKETPAEIRKLAKANKVTVSVPKPTAKPGEPIKVYYRDHRGMGTSRVFSPDVHGEEFASLAEEFKASNDKRIIHDAAEGQAAEEAAQKHDAAERQKVEKARRNLK